MTTAAFTAGPWKAHFEEAYYVTGPDLGRVAMMCNLKGAHGLGGRRSGDEAAANARLIAAAPELFDALKDLADDMSERFDLDSPSTNPGIKNTIAAARAAIAKALGSAS